MENEKFPPEKDKKNEGSSPGEDKKDEGSSPGEKGQEAKSLYEKLGFKSEEDMANSYKEQHATITRLSQEKSSLQRMLEENPYSYEEAGKKEEVSDEYEDPVKAATKAASKTAKREIAMARIEMECEKLRGTTPEQQQEWDNLQSYMQQVYQANPSIANRPGAVGYIYGEAKKRRETHLSTLRKEILGEGQDTSALKEKVKAEVFAEAEKNRAATVPSKGGVSSSSKTTNYDEAITQARDKGDAKGTIDAIFEKAMPKKE